MMPTAEGTALLPYAQSLINDYRILQERIAELNGLQQGLIRIGVFSSVATLDAKNHSGLSTG